MDERWVLTEEGIKAVEAFMKLRKITLRAFWRYKMPEDADGKRRSATNWYYARGDKGQSVSKQMIRDILTACELNSDDAQYYRQLPPAPPKKRDAVSRKGLLTHSVPPCNRLFTGRDDVLAELRDALAPEGAAVGLSGMGGIGKTQTAVAYVHCYRQEYNGVYWAGAESVEALNSGLAGFAAELKLPLPDACTQEEAAQAVRAWFQTQENWILVLDNADDIRTIAPHIPHYHRGRLLLTTRAHATASVAKKIALRRLEPEAGATLLLRRAGKIEAGQTCASAKEDDNAAANAISREVDGLPLALNQAGAYIEETQVTVAEYLRLYCEQVSAPPIRLPT